MRTKASLFLLLFPLCVVADSPCEALVKREWVSNANRSGAAKGMHKNYPADTHDDRVSQFCSCYYKSAKDAYSVDFCAAMTRLYSVIDV